MMSIKPVLVASVAIASLSAGTAFASGPDEFSMQPGGSIGTVTTYSDGAYTTGTTSYVQPLVDVTTTYNAGETVMQTETIQYDAMPVETMQYGTVEGTAVGEPVTVDINDYLLPESN